MKTIKLFLIVGVFISLNAYSQNSEILNKSITTRKIVADSILKASDSLFVGKFKSPGARVDQLKTSSLTTKTLTANNGSITQAVITTLNVLVSSQLGNFIGNNGSVNELSISAAVDGNPLFSNENGYVTKVSQSQYLSIPAVAFIPDRISPIEAVVSNLARGGIRQILNNGEVEGQAQANDDIFRLVAPLVFPLNASNQNIKFQNAKMCVLDKENPRDLAAVVYEVNSSEGQFPLIVNPKMAFKSNGNSTNYQCFDLSQGGDGSPFDIESSDNSYYVAVFPVSSNVLIKDIIKNPTNFVQPWMIDNPFLRLVHFIVEYKFQ